MNYPDESGVAQLTSAPGAAKLMYSNSTFFFDFPIPLIQEDRSIYSLHGSKAGKKNKQKPTQIKCAYDGTSAKLSNNTTSREEKGITLKREEITK